MKNRLVFMICLVGCIWFTLTVALSTADSKTVHGVPFLLLQKQINTLRHQVKELEKQDRNVDMEVIVDCNAGTVSDALSDAPPGGRLIITVEGNCVEDINITRDDVTLQGGSGTVLGHIKIDGARRIEIEGLTVTGGIAAGRGATVHIENCTIEVDTGDAVAVTHGGFVELVSNPLILSQEGCAIVATDGGEVRLQNNQMIRSIHGDPNVCASALGLFRGASARLRGGNTLVNEVPGGAVIDAADRSTIRQDGGFDVFDGRLSFTRNTNADIRNARITGFVSVRDSSFVRLRDSSVEGPLAIVGMSFLNLDRNVMVNGRADIALSSTLRMPQSNTLNGDISIGPRSQAYFDFGPNAATVYGTVTCGESIGSLPPDLVLTLHDSLFGQVTTSAGNPAFAYRGAAVGTPQGMVNFVNCN
jgi:hypothetical protein